MTDEKSGLCNYESRLLEEIRVYRTALHAIADAHRKSASDLMAIAYEALHGTSRTHPLSVKQRALQRAQEKVGRLFDSFDHFILEDWEAAELMRLTAERDRLLRELQP